MKKRILGFAAGALLMGLLAIPAQAARLLVPVGRVVGLELRTHRVTVTAVEPGSPAEAAGVQAGDRLLTLDGAAVTSGETLRRALDRSRGTVELTVARDTGTRTLRLTPEITPEGPRLGLCLRQGITGIGTVTFYDPETGSFGALGHGISEPSGQTPDFQGGSIWPARVVSARKGRPGEPGQLMGALTAREPLGTLEKNTSRGVFGKTKTPFSGQPLPVASPEEVRCGPAVILSAVESDTPREYAVEILKLDPKPTLSHRNLLLRITDPSLLTATNGIVQGMSGSPIIQDGKLVGAVTHVLVNDPTRGYGIFIENMLDAAS